MAIGGKWDGSENGRNKPKPLPWVATSCDRAWMVRRGSTVRVRQRALAKRPAYRLSLLFKWAPSFGPRRRPPGLKPGPRSARVDSRRQGRLCSARHETGGQDRRPRVRRQSGHAPAARQPVTEVATLGGRLELTPRTLRSSRLDCELASQVGEERCEILLDEPHLPLRPPGLEVLGRLCCKLFHEYVVHIPYLG